MCTKRFASSLRSSCPQTGGRVPKAAPCCPCSPGKPELRKDSWQEPPLIPVSSRLQLRAGVSLPHGLPSAETWKVTPESPSLPTAWASVPPPIVPSRLPFSPTCSLPESPSLSRSVLPAPPTYLSSAQTSPHVSSSVSSCVRGKKQHALLIGGGSCAMPPPWAVVHGTEHFVTTVPISCVSLQDDLALFRRL